MARQKKNEVAPSGDEPIVKPVKRKEVAAEDFDVIDGFVLENADKLQRVLEGEVKRAGVPEGGLLSQYGDLDKIPPEMVLAHYDKLNGYITKDVGGSQRVKIKNGSFWDFKKRKPHEEPKVIYLFRVGGEQVEVDDPSKLAQAVTTVQNVVSEKQQKDAERRARAKKKSLLKGEI